MAYRISSARVSRPRILYLTYDGVLEPLGQSQVLSYLERLAPEFAITLLSFEKPADTRDQARREALAARLQQQGIEWSWLPYHRRPPVVSTGWDIAAGKARARQLARTRNFAVVHARSYVPAVMAMALARTTGAKFLFDMRGLWVDEKVEAGSWPRGGVIYRAAKHYERRFLEEADGIVSLTHEGVRTLPQLGFDPARGIPVDVIPTCVDVQRFAPAPKSERLVAALSLDGCHVIGSVGTLSNRYLRSETLRYLGLLLRRMPDARILLVTRDDHAALRRDAAAAGIDLDRLVLTAAPFAEMPDYVRLLDVAVFFMKPLFAQKGSAATKMAEFLASGVPVIVNDGVADSSAIVRHERVGLVLDDLSDAGLEASVARVRALFGASEVAARCRAVALRLFDADEGARRYAALYRMLAGCA